MIKVSVPAKINITLTVNKINGKFHDLSSVVVSADIYDIIMVERADKDEICGVENIDTQGKIFRTIEKMRQDFSFSCVKISVQKNIPLGGGMGGSSGLMAGVIRGVDVLFSLDLPYEKAVEYADITGSDNAFMLKGGAGKIVGRSLVTDRFECASIPALIVQKGFCNTKSVFDAFDDNPDFTACYEQKVIDALKEGKVDEILRYRKNSLTPYSSKINENIRYALAELNGAFMTGSGSAVLSLLQNDDDVISKMVKMGYKVFKTNIGSYKTIVEKIDE